MTQIAQSREQSKAVSMLRLPSASLAGLALALCSISLSAQSPNNEPNVASAITGAQKPQPAPKKKTKNDRLAEDAYIAGARLLEHHDTAGAESKFARAVALAPDNGVYLMALASVREGHLTELVQSAGKARLLGQVSQAETLLAQARAIDPSNPIVAQHPIPGSASASNKIHSWIVDGPRIAGPIELKPTLGKKNFSIRSTIPEVARQVATAFGLKATLDSSVSNKQIRFDLEDVTYPEAMHALSEMGNLLVVPLTSTSVLIAKDDQENRTKFEHLIQETIYAAGMTNEQIAEISNMIKSVFEVRQISVENSFGSLVVRAPEATVKALNAILADLLDGGSEVMIELKLYSVARTKNVNIGATVPNQGGAYNVESAAAQLVQANQTAVNQAIAQGLIPANSSNIEIAAALIESGLATSTLLTNSLAFIGGGLTSTGLYSSTTATLNLALNSSDTRALDDIQLRVGERQSATFRAGSKYPITQSTYSTTAPTAVTSALAGASVNGVSVASLLGSATTSTIPQVQYEDLGVTLKATPTVQKSGLISVHLELKIESLAGGTVDNIPILDSNQLTSDVTVPDGGTAFLVSNMTKNEAAAVTGIPGLSELPGFQNSPEAEKTTNVAQLLMVLTPHLVRKRLTAGAGPAIPLALHGNSSE
jgi:Flp pilus assembly secretin CpaC